MKKNKYLTEIVFPLVLFLSFALGITFGIKYSYYFFIIPFLILAAFLIYNKIQKEKIISSKRKELEELWGQRQFDDISYKDLKRVYFYFKEFQKNRFYIDDITWNDLDMDIIFKKACHCITLPGLQYLYYLLRTPLFNKSKLKTRDDKINYFLENRNISQKIQYHLSSLEAKEDISLDIIWGDQKRGSNVIFILYIFLSVIIIPEIIFTIFFPQIGVFILGFSLFINAVTYSVNKFKILDKIREFSYFSKMIVCARELSNIKEDDKFINQSVVRLLYNKLKSLNRKINNLEVNRDSTAIRTDLELLFGLVDMIFLREPIIYYSTLNVIDKYKEDLKKLYLFLGELDAAIAVASYKSSLKYFSLPELTQNGNFIYTEKIYHPLLDNFVANDFSLKEKGALITGSNASGKSTFLKTIGVNVIFAQSLFFTFSKEFKSSFFRVFTSIGTLDSLISGDSYFMVEAKNLKRVIDSLDNKFSIMCILDEIFRGTNTTERIEAAENVLRFLSHRNCFTIVATHDLELTKLVDNKYKNYHFQEEIVSKDIKFDYIIKEGPSKTKNALKILKILGYPKEVYGEINKI